MTSIERLSKADILFIPGGRGASAACQDPRLTRAIAHFSRTAGTIAAIGSGQLIVAASGALTDCPACGDEALRVEFERRFRDTPFESEQDWLVRDRFQLGKNGMATLPLALQLVAATLGKSEADHVSRSLGRRPPSIALAIKR